MQFNYKPSPTQALFHQTKRKDNFAHEVLFGGAVGGGKSMAIIADAFAYGLLYPKSSILILRRTYPELQASIIDKCLEYYPPESYKYNSSDKLLQMVNGSKIKFGYLETDSDMYRYQGAEYSAIYFDELTHFSEKAYMFLQSRLRNTKGYPNIIRASANPIPFKQWVKDRFINGDKLYIKSTLADNPYLDTEEYTKRLLGLPDLEREALLHGNWDLSFGSVFKREHFKVISQDTYSAITRLDDDMDIDFYLDEGESLSKIITYMSVDVAVTDNKKSDASAFTIGTIDGNNDKYVLAQINGRWLSDELLNRILKCARDYNVQYIGIEDSSVSKTFIENIESAISLRNLPYVIIRLKPQGRNKVARIQQYLLSAINQNKLYFVENISEDFVMEAINFPEGEHDDSLDSLAYFIEMGNNLLQQMGGKQSALNYTTSPMGAW
ncbi:MAG: hypothetical protein EOM41_06710 [Bacilli bacterium]|nr:hypothetical protein [Bacilli bacterium]